ncbi:carbohydrate ABC transporter permease [Paenibacillus mucilaginosus]|uniref:Binding-protein-dependent transport system inner membrane component n=3 Tax=Paenibacillus mucilaginosus TaxID=61624 RepID=H6NMZ5_9BACL|nr:carbohydrate ABC transporter permease [Paenibacillus mucilaginosus]AEI43382.1 binding-protein-dependent transport system inner membrane component [Paenibacillus mucilaginosus KNP414]AFC31035.1 binding-protein-dependent transport system inner membrane component [Paenibacillus mucilaginosus 3016]AFH63353.1 sugar ABC transporter permease [Paenibacillus mucilaginosus K02]MCG7212070.1 carbohydrate ABC transporter permease [Paenibacillus mucilaginosus]WDM24946.1 carbohydrate ABC transporter perme
MTSLRKIDWKAGLVEVLLILLALTIIAPLLIMILGSFKTSSEVLDFSLALPRQWMFSNYAQVIEQGGLLRAFWNGVLISGVSSVLNIITTSAAAFVMIRRDTKVSNFIYLFFFMGLIAPMSIITTIRVVQWLGLYGTITSAVLIYTAMNSAFSVFLYAGFMKSIPRALDEVAFLEGANILDIYLRVIFPLIVPVNATVAIMVFMSVWNDITIPIYFLTDSSNWTMPLSVYNFYGKFSRDWNLVFADLTLTSLPVLILFLLAQKYIVSGMTAGAIKG